MQIEVKLTGATKVIKEGEGEKEAGGENWVGKMLCSAYNMCLMKHFKD